MQGESEVKTETRFVMSLFGLFVASKEENFPQIADVVLAPECQPTLHVITDDSIIFVFESYDTEGRGYITYQEFLLRLGIRYSAKIHRPYKEDYFNFLGHFTKPKQIQEEIQELQQMTERWVCQHWGLLLVSVLVHPAVEAALTGLL